MALHFYLPRFSLWRSFTRVDSEAYDLEAGPSKRSPVANWILRILLLVLATAIPVTYIYDIENTPLLDVHTLPDLASIYRYEDLLPQHNIETGLQTRYVRFLGQHHWGAGFNNLWEEFILLHEIALRANRSYVFRTLIFADHTEWPMNTFMAGPTAGGPLPASVDAPLAISSTWWEVVCPPARRRVVDANAVWNELQLGEKPDASQIVEGWANYLKNLNETCVEVTERGFFDLDFWFGSPQRAITIWPSLSMSPILAYHSWSKAVYKAVSRNLPLLTDNKMTAETERFSHIIEDDRRNSAPLREYRGLSNVIALHIRRGDYEGHCWILAHFDAPYASWNVIPGLPDVYKPDNTSQDTKMLIMPHCFPSAQQAAERVQHVAKEYAEQQGATADKLETVFLMTNGNEEFINDLRGELKKVGFDKLITAKDMQMNDIEKKAGMIVDMEIGIRSALFIGNGFSTLTSTVVALRAIRGAPMNASRFW